jgi:U3 small nucleolar RNA-associated protein 18
MEMFKPSPCGRWIGFVGSSRKGGGLVNIINAVTGQWVAQCRVDGRGGVADFAWWSDGEGISVAGKGGEVSEWDGRLKRVVARWTDQGAVGTTVLRLGGQAGLPSLGGDRWVAIGSSSGVVNLYDRRSWALGPKRGGVSGSPSVPDNPKPIRILDQLTTPISHISFSIDGQLLVIASRWKKDALRLGMFSDFNRLD